MSIVLHVRDFGKIKEADIDLDSYTLFIGDNNSGKSYLLQLMQGIGFESMMNLTFSIPVSDGLIIDKSMFDNLIENINKNLKERKEEICRNIFRNEVRIGDLWITLENFDYEGYYIREVPYEEISSGFLTREEYEAQKNFQLKKFDKIITVGMAAFRCADFMILGYLFNTISGNMYIPTARTGLLMLYRSLFANSTKNMFNNKPQDFSLTKPVFEFLERLQTYDVNSAAVEYYSDIIQFMEENVIDGKLNVGLNNQIFYTSKNTNVTTPLYISSAMINELTPIWLLLTNTQGVSGLLIDEVEASLHPRKQVEMARLLNRMHNKGVSIHASTHSDTMVAAINNLYVLSKMKQDGFDISELLEKTGYQEEDLLKHEMKVYQFTNCGEYSQVKELSYTYLTGFEFETFDDALDKIVEDAQVIMGD